MSKHVDLSATPIVETSVEEIQKALIEIEQEDLTRLSDVQAQEKIQRLSENVRYVIELNNKLKTSNAAYARNAGDLAAHILRLEREINELRTDSEIEEDPTPLFEVPQNNIPPIKEPEKLTLSRYFTYSQQYSEFSSLHFPAKHGSDEHFNSAVMSLVSESLEMLEALDASGPLNQDLDNLKKEMSDFLWSIAMICDACRFSITSLFEESEDTTTTYADPTITTKILKICTESGKLTGISRKIHYHNHEKNLAPVWRILVEIVAAFHDTLDFVGWEIEDIMKMNLEKLQKRYPEGQFSPEASIARVDTAP